MKNIKKVEKTNRPTCPICNSEEIEVIGDTNKCKDCGKEF